MNDVIVDLTHKLHAANKAAFEADQAARKVNTQEAWDERARAYDAATAAQIALDDATYSRK